MIKIIKNSGPTLKFKSMSKLTYIGRLYNKNSLDLLYKPTITKRWFAPCRDWPVQDTNTEISDLEMKVRTREKKLCESNRLLNKLHNNSQLNPEDMKLLGIIMKDHRSQRHNDMLSNLNESLELLQKHIKLVPSIPINYSEDMISLSEKILQDIRKLD